MDDCVDPELMGRTLLVGYELSKRVVRLRTYTRRLEDHVVRQRLPGVIPTDEQRQRVLDYDRRKAGILDGDLADKRRSQENRTP